VNLTTLVVEATGMLDKPSTHLLLTLLPELQRFRWDSRAPYPPLVDHQPQPGWHAGARTAITA
jgi:hypothetical protein